MNETASPYEGFVIRNARTSYKATQFVFNSISESVLTREDDVPSPYVVNVTLEKNRNFLRYMAPNCIVYTATITDDYTSDSHLCIGNVLINTTWLSRQWIGTINSLKLTVF